MNFESTLVPVEENAGVVSLAAKANGYRNIYYHRKNLTLINDNVLNPEIFPKGIANLIVTSPPYNVGIEYNSNDDGISYEKYCEFSNN